MTTALTYVSRRSGRVWQRNRDVFLTAWKTDMLPILFEPLVILAVMGTGIGRVVDKVQGQDYLDYIGPGVLAAYVMFAPSFECSWGTYVRMAVRKTFDAIIATPVSIEDVITGELLWGTTRAVVMAAVMLVILAALGITKSPAAMLVIPLAVLEGLMFASLSMVYTSKVPSVNAFNYFFSVFIYPMFFFSGVFFPLSDLNHALRIFAWCLPLTPAVYLTRHLISGDFTLTMLWCILGMIAATAVLYVISLVLMRRRLVV